MGLLLQEVLFGKRVYNTGKISKFPATCSSVQYLYEESKPHPKAFQRYYLFPNSTKSTPLQSCKGGQEDGKQHTSHEFILSTTLPLAMMIICSLIMRRLNTEHSTRGREMSLMTQWAIRSWPYTWELVFHAVYVKSLVLFKWLAGLGFKQYTGIPLFIVLHFFAALHRHCSFYKLNVLAILHHASLSERFSQQYLITEHLCVTFW